MSSSPVHRRPGRPLRWARILLVLAAWGLVGSVSVAQDASDPFAVLSARQNANAAPVPVPPRALAVIPERHTGRLIKMVDVLVAIDPQLDDVATGAGLDGGRAIQLRTREARVPIFVQKNDASIATLLQLPIGSRVEVRGVLISRGSRYLFLASEVRPAPQRRRER